MNKRTLLIILTMGLAMGNLLFYTNSLTVQSQGEINNYHVLVEQIPIAASDKIIGNVV